MTPGLSFLDRVQLRMQRHLVDPLEHKVRAHIRRVRNVGRVYRPLFVAGVSGSGTSFAALALAQRFECAGLVYEMDSQVARRSVLSVPSLDAFACVADYERAIAPKDSWSADEVREDLLVLCRAYASGPGSTMVLKGPDINLVRAALMHRCFPDAHFVLIFRDPAANIEGLRRKWAAFGRDPLSESIRFYREAHERFLDAALGFPERVVGLQYEALVEDTPAMLGQIGERFGLSPATRAPRFPASPNVEGRGVRNVKGGRVDVVRDANRRARDRLDAEALHEVERSLSPLYERLETAPWALRAGSS